MFADDNLNSLTLSTAADLQPLLQVYAEYQQVSGLNVNIRKKQALFINTFGAVLAGLEALGIETPQNIKHLGLHLGQDIERMVTETMIKIDPKALSGGFWQQHLPQISYTELCSSDSTHPDLQPCRHVPTNI